MLRLLESVFSNSVSITCRWYKLESTFVQFLHAKLCHACNHCVIHVIFVHEIFQGCQFCRTFVVSVSPLDLYNPTRFLFGNVKPHDIDISLLLTTPPIRVIDLCIKSRNPLRVYSSLNHISNSILVLFCDRLEESATQRRIG